MIAIEGDSRGEKFAGGKDGVVWSCTQKYGTPPGYLDDEGVYHE
jgi:hypothetical protein